MKQIIILFTFISLSHLVKASNLPAEIKKGDWFIIEFANTLEDYSSPVDGIDYCAPTELKQLSLRCEVIEKTKESLVLNFKFERMFHISENGEYSDTYFQEDGFVKSSTFNIGVRVNRSIDSVSYSLPSDSDSFAYSRYSRKVDLKLSRTSSVVYADQFSYEWIKEMISSFLMDWHLKSDYELLPGIGKVNIAEFYKYRIVNGNMSVKSNFSVQVLYTEGFSKESFEIFTSQNFILPFGFKGKKLATGEIYEGKGNAAFYLEEQKLLELCVGDQKIKFVGTPGDKILVDLNLENPLNSIQSIYDADQKYNITITSNQNRFVKNPGILKHTSSIDSAFMGITEEMNTKVNLLNQFKNEITSNWYKKQLKEINYWAAECMIYWCNKQKIQTNFSELYNLDAFRNIDPLFDYYLNIKHLDSYIGTITRNSITPSMESLANNHGFSRHFNSNENYEIADAIYWGYPKHYTLKVLVRQDLEFGGYKRAKDNYEKFISTCKYPPFIEELESVYEEIGNSEPGKSILDLNLNFLLKSNLGLEKKKFKIVHFVVSDHNNDFNRLKRVIEGVCEVAELDDKMELYIVYPKELDSEIHIKKPESDFFETKLIELNSIETIHTDLNVLHSNFYRTLILSPENKVINRSDGINLLHQNIIEFIQSQSQPTSKADPHRLSLVILAILVGFGLLSWIVIRLRTHRIKKKEAARRKLIELELRAIRSQMNPHFMFNSLNSIQNLVNQNKIEQSNIYLSEFAEMMRLVLNNSEKQLVPLEEELQLIESYLQLEKLRIPFIYNINIDQAVLPASEEIPAMLIHPFVENAVVHGIAPSKGGIIELSLQKENSRIICEVTDNGIGISQRSKQRKGNGKAIQMIKERIKILNTQNTIPLTLDITDRKETGGIGTRIRICIPV